MTEEVKPIKTKQVAQYTVVSHNDLQEVVNGVKYLRNRGYNYVGGLAVCPEIVPIMEGDKKVGEKQSIRYFQSMEVVTNEPIIGEVE